MARAMDLNSGGGILRALLEIGEAPLAEKRVKKEPEEEESDGVKEEVKEEQVEQDATHDPYEEPVPNYDRWSSGGSADEESEESYDPFTTKPTGDAALDDGSTPNLEESHDPFTTEPSWDGAWDDGSTPNLDSGWVFGKWAHKWNRRSHSYDWWQEGQTAASHAADAPPEPKKKKKRRRKR